MPQTPADDPVWRELRPLLDAEVNRLPAKYRAPVVLCYFEGKTNEEAARELGCPVGTVKCHLARAREMLRKRLTKRGLAASSVLLSAALADQASAAVSPALLETTIQTAGLFAAGEAAAAGAISFRAVFLAQGALHTMFMHKLQTAVIVLAAFGLIGTGAGTLFSRTPVSEASEKQLPDTGLLAAAPAEAAQSQGRQAPARRPCSTNSQEAPGGCQPGANPGKHAAEGGLGAYREALQSGFSYRLQCIPEPLASKKSRNSRCNFRR